MNAQETIEAGKLMQAYAAEWRDNGIRPNWVQYYVDRAWHTTVEPEWNWKQVTYRRRPESKLVEFTPYDITTAMQFRRKETSDWFVPISATTSGVHLFGHGLIKYDLLLTDYECRHFNDTEWRPCGKVVES